MTLTSKNNHTNEIGVFKLVKNEALQDSRKKFKFKMAEGSHFGFMQISISRKK